MFGTLGSTAMAETLRDDAEVLVEAPIAHPPNRRIELRRALESNVQSGTAHDRRRLSLEEREALHRDLRAVMRNVNADHGDGERR